MSALALILYGLSVMVRPAALAQAAEIVMRSRPPVYGD